MVKKIICYFYDRMASSQRVHPIYILPTLDGFKVIGLNLILLILGLVYANNYVLLFNFILFCLFLGSMFYTHFNLSGLKLESIGISNFHVNEEGFLSLYFTTKNSQGHYFIRPYFKSALIEITDQKKTFSATFGNKNVMQVPLKGIKRGKDTISSIYIETLFPFNFFRCFTFFKVNQEFFIYPEKKNLHLHEEVKLIEFDKSDGEDFFLRDYQIGDSLKRVDWKKLAQTNKWYTRQFQAEKPNPIMLVLNETLEEDILKSICFSMLSLHQQDIKYGLKLGHDVLITPENSPQHLTHCLQELARYET